MSFRHIVLFRWQPETSPEALAGLVRDLEALAAGLDGVRSYACGTDLGLSGDNGYDFAIVGEFDDKAAWDLYMADPEHDRIRAEVLAPIVAERAVAQIES
jgi:quinol monooxygenase YgiN